MRFPHINSLENTGIVPTILPTSRIESFFRVSRRYAWCCVRYWFIAIELLAFSILIYWGFDPSDCRIYRADASLTKLIKELSRVLSPNKGTYKLGCQGQSLKSFQLSIRIGQTNLKPSEIVYFILLPCIRRVRNITRSCRRSSTWVGSRANWNILSRVHKRHKVSNRGVE